jgi:hypothetical protein
MPRERFGYFSLDHNESLDRDEPQHLIRQTA